MYMTVTIHERLNLAQFQQGREGDSANGRADAAGGQEQEEQEEEQPQLQPQLQQQGSPQREQRGADHLSDLVQHKRPADQAYLEPPCTLRSPRWSRYTWCLWTRVRERRKRWDAVQS